MYHSISKPLAVAAILLVIFTLQGCGEDDLVSFDALLTGDNAKVWVIHDVEIDDTTNIFSFDDTCDFDNNYIFYSKGAFIEYTGKIKCEESEADSIVGSWDFNEVEQAIYFKDEDDKGHEHLFKFSNEKLIIQKNKNGIDFYYYYSQCDTCKAPLLAASDTTSN